MCQSFISSLKDLGVKNGDILYIASDFTLFLSNIADKYTIESINAKLNELIDNLQDLIGSSATLLFPIFSWDFNKGKSFDIKNTKGATGALSNWILKNRNDFVRTKHPMYSFMVWGKDADILAKMENIDAFGQFSPFGYIHKNDAKIVFFDIPVRNGITFVHYVEENLQVPYRYFKAFEGEYIDINGKKSIKSYVMYVRDLKIKSHEYLPDEFFIDQGALKISEFDSHQLKLMSAKKAFDIMRNDLLCNQGRNIYRFENYSLEWTQKATHSDEL